MFSLKRKERFLFGKNASITVCLQSLITLADNVQALSVERLSILEQAAPLADEFARTCDDLDAWLNTIEVELENCPAVVAGMPAEQVRIQKEHNKVSEESFLQELPLW